MDCGRGSVRYVQEKIGGERLDAEALEDVNNCVHEIEVEDLKWWGQKFTWWNKQEGAGK